MMLPKNDQPKPPGRVVVLLNPGLSGGVAGFLLGVIAVLMGMVVFRWMTGSEAN